MTQINAFRLISSEINFFCTNYSLAKNEELIMMDMFDMFIKKKTIKVEWLFHVSGY